MMRASVRGCASGGMVSSMSKQRQARAASALVAPVRVAFDQHGAEVGAVNGAGLRFGSAVREPWDYVPRPPFVVDDDGYLISDSMGQNNRHAGRMLAYGPAMKARQRERGFVGVDLSMPYVKGSPGKMVAPDLFVALAARQDEDRNSMWNITPAPAGWPVPGLKGAHQGRSARRVRRSFETYSVGRRSSRSRSRSSTQGSPSRRMRSAAMRGCENRRFHARGKPLALPR